MSARQTEEAVRRLEDENNRLRTQLLNSDLGQLRSVSQANYLAYEGVSNMSANGSCLLCMMEPIESYLGSLGEQSVLADALPVGIDETRSGDDL